MIIYGVALLAACLLVGLFLGDVLGSLIGVEANVGGVGIAMLMLMVLANFSGERFRISPASSNGITFWSAMYIPIVVAMAAKQNVYAAITGGPLALMAGVLAVTASFALIPLMTRLASKTADDEPETRS